MAPSRKIRVLCLHGYRMNAKVMAAQTQVLRQALGADAAEFVFLDAPYEADGPTDPVVQKLFGDTAPFREWFRAATVAERDANEADSGTDTAAEIARVRESMDPDNEWYCPYDGVERGIALINEIVGDDGPFDVAVGFSQGAIMLTLLSALHIHRYNVAPWNLAICVGALSVVDPQFRSLFESLETGEKTPVQLSSVHIVGEKDPIRLESLKLTKLYQDYYPASLSSTGRRGRMKIVYEHAGGHKFPSLKGNETFFEELVRVIHDQCNAEADRPRSEALPSRL
ncbi:hypothetical protein Gpo141_00006204 [Globisporangium polare]